MPGSLVSCKHRIAESYLIAIVQHTVYLGGRIREARVVTVLKVGLAAGFDDAYVSIHDHVFCAGEFPDLGTASIVVEVRMTDQQDLHVTEVKAQFLDTLANQRD